MHDLYDLYDLFDLILMMWLMTIWAWAFSNSLIPFIHEYIEWKLNLSRPNSSWRVAKLVPPIFILALLRLGPVLLQVLFVLDNDYYGLSDYGLRRMMPFVLFANLLLSYYDLLQILLCAIAIIHSARYSPRDQMVFYWIARVEYTSLGILAIWDLFHNYLRLVPRYGRPSGPRAISVLMSMVHVVSTTILLAASIRLKVKSNPEREESKALSWLVADTTVLFSRSVVHGLSDKIFHLEPTGMSWSWIIQKLMILAFFLADRFLFWADQLQSSDPSPMPYWVPPEVDTED